MTLPTPTSQFALPTLIAIVDSARARLLWLTKAELDRPSTLREEAALVHPNARIKEGDRYTDSFPLGSRVGMSPRGQTFDDHREANDLEERHRFAREIADQLVRLTRENKVAKVVIVASHAEYAPLLEEVERRTLGVEVRHAVLELTKFGLPEIHDALRQHGLVR